MFLFLKFLFMLLRETGVLAVVCSICATRPLRHLIITAPNHYHLICNSFLFHKVLSCFVLFFFSVCACVWGWWWLIQ